MQGAGTSAEQLEVSPLHSGVDRNVVGILGGPGRDRTDDLFHAMEARSQLRHRPTPTDGRGCPPRLCTIHSYLPGGHSQTPGMSDPPGPRYRQPKVRVAEILESSKHQSLGVGSFRTTVLRSPGASLTVSPTPSCDAAKSGSVMLLVGSSRVKT